ncbi:hypothetical protein ACFL6I_28090, partial [candidate division KSB1 bacterium]
MPNLTHLPYTQTVTNNSFYTFQIMKMNKLTLIFLVIIIKTNFVFAQVIMDHHIIPYPRTTDDTKLIVNLFFGNSHSLDSLVKLKFDDSQANDDTIIIRAYYRQGTLPVCYNVIDTISLD